MMATPRKPAAKPSSTSPAVEDIPSAASDEATPPATPPADEGGVADQTEANEAAERDSKTYVVLSAVKVGGKWRTAGDKLVGLPSRLADQLAGRIEEIK